MTLAHAKSRPYVPTDNAGAFSGVADPLWWHKFGLCAQVDPELFHPAPTESSAAAEAVCARCPVQKTCLVAGVETREPHAVYGGLTPKARKSISARDLDFARRQAADEEVSLRGWVAA